MKSKGKVPAEVPVMKTVIEGGATVQVSTQDLSDTDMEDDENVYNIKVKKTVIKLLIEIL